MAAPINTPDVLATIGYWIQAYAPLAVVPITAALKKAYSIAIEIRDLMIKQNKILDELSQKLGTPKA